MQKKTYPGLLISFEGLDCSGKTTIINKLIDNKIFNTFLSKGFNEIVFTKEPGSDYIPFCQEMRKTLLTDSHELIPMTQAFLFAANRSEHVSKLIQPKLETGSIIITDRYVDSSYLYQGMDPSMNLAFVEQINHYAIQGIYPDITFCCCIDEATWKVRMENRQHSTSLDQLELRYQNFCHMYNVFTQLIKQYAEQGRKYCLLYSNQSTEEIISVIKQEINNLICSTIKTDPKLS